MDSDKKINNKLRKTSKNKTGYKKCENFCKNDYTLEMNKVYKKFYEKFYEKLNESYKDNKQNKNITLNSCKKVFCNEKCVGFDQFGQKLQKIFKKGLKNGFQNTYKQDIIDALKNKGALSGCVNIPYYDVFHK